MSVNMTVHAWQIQQSIAIDDSLLSMYSFKEVHVPGEAGLLDSNNRLHASCMYMYFTGRGSIREWHPQYQNSIITILVAIPVHIPGHTVLYFSSFN